MEWVLIFILFTISLYSLGDGSDSDSDSLGGWVKIVGGVSGIVFAIASMVMMLLS